MSYHREGKFKIRSPSLFLLHITELSITSIWDLDLFLLLLKFSSWETPFILSHLKSSLLDIIQAAFFDTDFALLPVSPSAGHVLTDLLWLWIPVRVFVFSSWCLSGATTPSGESASILLWWWCMRWHVSDRRAEQSFVTLIDGEMGL